MASIRLGTAVNIRLFQTLSAALKNNDSNFTHLIDGEALEDEFGRFRVWSGNLGALQKGHSALDYRLRDSPLLSSNALKLLKELEENITEAISIVTGVRLPYEQQPRSEEKDDEDVDDDFYSEDEDEGSETAAPKTELEQRFREIVDIVDNLYKLSVRIRTPTIRSRSLKASSYQPKDPETGVDILDQYAAFDLQHTRELVRHERMQHTKEIKDDDPITMRLSKAITLRRRQFMYWRRHRDKLGMSTVLEEGPLAGQPTVERSENLNRHTTLEAQASNPIITALKQSASEKTGKTMLSGTEATHHHQSLDEIVDSRSVTSYATTVRDLTGKGIDLPPPPKGADGDKDFECPYCFIICPARYGKGRAWKTHILQDLQPYLCTYQDCESSEQIFRSRREWSDHEASHRKAWRCPEHPNAVYRSKSGLEGHLRHKHPDSFPEAQLDSIINVGETSTVDTREKCPICFVEVDTEGGFNLQNHVANHLERLASFALPRNVNDDEDGASSVASRGMSANSGSQDLSDVSFYSDASQGEEEELRRDLEKSESSLLFHEHDWDARDIATPSGQGLLSAELLGHLPDSSQTSQKRLDFFFPSQDIAEDDFDEQIFGDETAEVGERLGEMQAFRTYLLSLPGAESVQFIRRLEWWRGNARFRDQASAREAMGVFDKGRFPEVRITQGVENKALLKFSFPVTEKAEKGLLSPTRQSTNDEVEDDSPTSTKSMPYYEQRSRLEIMPLLPASEIPTLRALYRTRKLLQRDQSYAPSNAFNQIVSFCYYDITRLKVDAIVNSANGAMKTTGLDGSLNNHIHKQAGPGLQRECKAAGKIKPGQARLTSGCDLPASYVIHAARPQYSGSKGMGKFKVLTECYRSSLKTAMNHGIKTIAFPCLAAGGCGFPSRVAAKIALQEVREFLDVYTGYTFERIIFCVYSAIDEKAYKDFLPVFFPPTHGDLENATPFEPSRNRASLATQLGEASIQVNAVYRDLLDFSEQIPEFPQDVMRELHDINTAFDSLQALFFGPKDKIQNLNGLTVTDIDLICSVMQNCSGGVLEFIEQSKASISTQKSKMWDDYNFHMKSSKGMDLLGLLEICLNFVQSLDDILSHDGIEPYEMATMRVRLGSYRLKITGEGHKGVQDHFDEVMYTREFQRSATPLNRADTIKLHQIASIARLYQLGDLEYKPTLAIASANFNHTVYLLRDDITRVESDVIVNSTDPHFSSMGTLDRTLFKRGGPAMQQACNEFGSCKEGDIKVTPGFLLPAKHVIHAMPPQTYRSNSKDILRKLYREILYNAQSLKATSIAIPAIGTGTLNYPRRDCASLALEEVKRFLESAEPTSSIEKIIFCVFGSNDEHTYKSLLPVYFPPVDMNLNKALPANINIPSSTLDPKVNHNLDELNTHPKRSLFGSLGEAFRNVRFGKQPVIEQSRALNSAEEHALTNFEDHCHTCNICNNIAKLYAEGKTLCPAGYAMAQLILQYLYMEQDRSVYSTSLKFGNREKVDVPERYRYSWNLLVAVEMSQRGGEDGRPFVNPDERYLTHVEGEEQRENTPFELIEHNAEVTVPAKEELHMESGLEPKTFTAMVFRRSPDKATWVPLSYDECIICISSSGFEVYETEQQMRVEFPLWNLRLATARIHEISDTELTIDPKGNGDVLLIQSSDPTKHDLLLQVLERDGNAHQLVRLPRMEQAVTEPALGKEHPSTLVSMKDMALALSGQGKYADAEVMHRETLALREKVLEKEHPDTLVSMNNLAQALSNQEKYEEAEVMHRETLALREKVLGKEHPETLVSMNNLAQALSHQEKYAEAEVMHRETLALREKVLGKEHLETLASMNEVAQALSDQEKYTEAEVMHRETLALREKVLGKEHLETQVSINNLAYALFRRGKYVDAEEMYHETLAPKEKAVVAPNITELEKLPPKEEPKRFTAQTLHHPPDKDNWKPLSLGQSIVHVYSSRVDVYETEEQTKAGIPLWGSNLTAAWVGQSSDTALIVDSKDRMGSVLFRSQSPAEHDSLLQALTQAQSKLRETASTISEPNKSTELEQVGTEHHTLDPIKPELEIFKAFLLRWSGVTEGWVPLHPEESFIHIYPGKATAELYATDDKTQPPLMYLDLTSLWFSKDSDLNIKIDRRGWKEPIMLRSQSSAARDVLLSKM
jgi:O-acetyl-ADP-ribose deacetylase (regulator of RNase III)/tetratricopeptide (TPR) repeat protein